MCAVRWVWNVGAIIRLHQEINDEEVPGRKHTTAREEEKQLVPKFFSEGLAQRLKTLDIKKL